MDSLQSFLSLSELFIYTGISLYFDLYYKLTGEFELANEVSDPLGQAFLGEQMTESVKSGE